MRCERWYLKGKQSCEVLGLITHKREMYLRIVSFIGRGLKYLGDPGKVWGCSTNTFVINSVSDPLVKISLRLVIDCFLPICSISHTERIYQMRFKTFIRWVGGRPVVYHEWSAATTIVFLFQILQSVTNTFFWPNTNTTVLKGTGQTQS